MELLLIAGALVGLYYYNLARAGGNLIFFPTTDASISIDGFTPQIQTDILVQNPSNSTIEVKSFAGNVFNNNTLIGNVSHFTPVVVPPNSEVRMSILIRLNTINLVSDIINIFQSKIRTQSIDIKGSANANSVQIPVELTFQLF